MTVDSADAAAGDTPPPSYFDVIVVGGGAAGLYTALCLPETLSVGLITKDNLSVSASDWAQGGIAAAIAPEDSPELHFQDTLRAGVGLCEPESVRFLVEEAAACIDRLVQMGVAFDRKPTGNLALTLEAAHSRHRVLHAADTTGHALVTTLAQQVMQRPHIQVLSEMFVLGLWLTESDPPQCQGVVVAAGDAVFWVRSQAVVLATGGGGQVYAQTTNPLASTGDGVAIAWRAGAEVRDLEFFQFHPTALFKPGAPHFLISEAVRGEGAHLVDRQGRRFAFDYHPKGELAPRDVVSRAIFYHLQGNAADSVGLDLRPIPPDTIQHRFPNIIQVCQHWGVDVFQEPIPVAPAAHYWMGGVTTNIYSQTQIPGLYALGETASTGIHGANRLASNSLLECIVFGQTMAALGLSPQGQGSQTAALQFSTQSSTSLPDTALQAAAACIAQIHQELPALMWLSAGICRNHKTLAAAIAKVSNLRSQFQALAVSQWIEGLQPGVCWQLQSGVNLRQWGEARNLLDVSDLILQSALFRTESRGGHYRDDYPQTDSAWRVHTVIRGREISQSHPLAAPTEVETPPSPGPANLL